MMLIKNSFYFFCSAIVLALAMCYPQTLWFAGFLFLFPILFLLKKDKDISRRDLYYLFWVSNFLFSMLSTLWFLKTYPLDWMGVPSGLTSFLVIAAAWVLFSFCLSVVTISWIYIEITFSDKNYYVRACLSAAVWVCMEYLRSWVIAIGLYGQGSLFGPHHTYYSLGYLASNVPFVKELLAVGGLYAASFCFILVNYMLFGVYLSYKNNDGKKFVFLGITILLIIGASNLWVSHLRGTDSLTTESALVTVVNSQLPSATNRAENVRKTATTLEGLSKVVHLGEVIVFPENINVLLPFYNSRDGISIPERLGASQLLIGSYSTEKIHSLFYFSPKGKTSVFYEKQLLMPVSEYSVIWLSGVFRVLEFFGFDGLPYRKPQQGNSVQLFKLNNIIFFGSLCSENISPYIYRDAVRSGATILLNVTSHAPFRGSSLLTRQTIAINTVRAIESGRYFVTASNRELSFIISDDGRFVHGLTSKKIGEFTEVVPVRTYMTPYVLYGDYVVVISFVATLIYFLWFRKKV